MTTQLKTINLFVDEYFTIKNDGNKYPNLFKSIENINEEHMTDWLRLNVNKETFDEFEKMCGR